LRQRLAIARHALATLQELTGKPKLSVVERDEEIEAALRVERASG